MTPLGTAQALPTRFQWTSGSVPTWAGRAVLGIAIFAAVAVVGTGMGLALSAVLLALGAIAYRVRPPALIPIIDLRVAPAPPARDPWLRVWWALAAGLAPDPAPARRRVGRDPVDPRRGRARLARRHRRAPLARARRRAGRDVVAAAAGARAHLEGGRARHPMDGSRTGRPRRADRRGAARDLRPAAGQRRRGLHAISRRSDAGHVGDRSAGRACARAGGVHRGRRRAPVRPAGPTATARAPGQARARPARVGLAARRARRPVRRVRRDPVHDRCSAAIVTSSTRPG